MHINGISLIDLLVSGVLAVVMFGIGLSLTLRDFTQIARHPTSFSLALSSQMVLLPLIGFLLAEISGLPPETRVGLVVLAACPGGATAGFITYLVKANTALSLALTSINSLLTLFSLPLVVSLALGYYFGAGTKIVLPFWDTFTHIFIITLVPAFLGVAFRHKLPALAARIQPIARYAMMAMLLAVFSIKLFANSAAGGADLSSADFIALLPPTVLQNMVCIALGFGLLRLFRRPLNDCITAAVESGVHNTTLAFLITGTLLHNEQMVKPALIYALFSFWTALLFGWVVARRSANS